MERKSKAATQTGIYLLIVGAILVLVNAFSFSNYKRFDLTKSERYTLSKGSANLVKNLPQQLQLDVYVTRGLPKQEVFIQDLTDLLSEYERAGDGKVEYKVIEPKTDEERAAAKDAGLQEAMFGDQNETGKDQATIARGYMGIAFKYGSEKSSIPMLSPDQAQGLEFWITNKIREISDKADGKSVKIGVITGKDEIKLSDANLVAAQPGGRGGPNMQGILQQAFPFYQFEDVDLKDGESEINKELGGIIITQPGKDYNEKELGRIDDFLMLGDKSVAIFAGAVNLKNADPSMKAELNTRGLEKLLDGYGVEMKKEAVLDWGRSISIPVQSQSGQQLWFRAPGVVQVQTDPGLDDKEQYLDTSFAGFFRLDELAFPFPSTLVAHPEKQPSATLKVVARSTPRTTVDGSDTMDMKISSDWRPKGEYGQRALAITVDGKLKSAFGKGESATPSRLLVISSSEFLANPFARAGNPPPMPPQMAMMGGMGGDEDLQMLAQPYAQKYLTTTILALKNTLDWMSGDSDLIAVSAKLIGDTNLTYSNISKPKADATDDEATLAKKQEEYKFEREKTQTRVQWSLILLGPVLFAAFGLIRWQRRESARDSITLG